MNSVKIKIAFIWKYYLEFIVCGVGAIVVEVEIS